MHRGQIGKERNEVQVIEGKPSFIKMSESDTDISVTS